MRLRKIAGADEFVAAHGRVLKPKELNPEWLSELASGRQVYLEIGMGKGDFVLGMAERFPDTLFLGMEKYTSVLLKALQKYDKSEQKRENLWFLCENAMELTELFPPESLDGIYLNFSDPWPKERYAKRRLTAPAFLERYHPLLKQGKTIEFKTDNPLLFEYSVETFENSPLFEIKEINRDLHQNGNPQDNVMTEYEKKFSAKGHPIYKLIAQKK